MKNALLGRLALVACMVVSSLSAGFAAAPLIQNSGMVGFNGVGARSAQLYAQVAAQGEAASWVIEYGLTTSYGKQTPKVDVPNGMFVGTYPYLMGLAPVTTYNYRVKATSKSGLVATGPNKTFTTIATAAVVIDSALAGEALVAAGNDIYLTVNVTAGTDPLTYKWKRNGVLLRNSSGSSSRTPNYIRGADYVNLSISNVTSAMAGTYTCEVSNPDSPAQTSSPLLVTVVTVTPGVAFTKKEGETFSLTATLTPPNPAATFAWEAGSVADFSGYGTVSGVTSSTLTVASATPIATDEYWCHVTLGAVTVESVPVEVDILPKPVISTIEDKTFSVCEEVNLDVFFTETTSVKVSGLPLGLTYSAKTQKITGKPLKPTPLDEPAVVIITASNSAGAAEPMVFTITVNALSPNMIGSFEGLISRDVDEKQLGGQVSFTVTSTGDVTGTLLLAVGKYPFKSNVTTDTGGGATVVYLNDLKSGSLPIIDTAAIYIASDGSLSGNIDAFFGYTGGIYNGSRNPWAEHNPFLTAGTFNCSLTPDSGALADPSFPHGHGFVSLNVSRVGIVTFIGKTSDGLVVTGKSMVSATGEVPIFGPQAGGTASLYGAPIITAKDVAGTCDWKGVSRINRAYPTGFNLHTLTVLGKRYVKPLAAKNEIILGLSKTALNAQVSFSDGGLASDVDQSFTITNQNMVQMPTVPASNPNLVSLKLDLVTGIIEGKFSVTNTNPLPPGQLLTRTATFFGLVIPGTSEARGFFTLPKLPSAGPPVSNTSITTSDMLSGITVLGAPPP